MADGATPTARTLAAIRLALLGITALGTAGVAAELALTGHYEGVNQAIPLAMSAAGVATMLWMAIRPGRVALRLLQMLMLLFIATGATGSTLHFLASAEFQRDIDPALSGLALMWKVVEATSPPTLAPGVYVQLGLLGLLFTYRHPVAGAATFDELSLGG